MIRGAWRYRMIRWPVRLAVIYLLLAVIPVMPWRPVNCAKETAVGELGDTYASYMAASFEVDQVYHWRLGNAIFLRFLPAYDGTKEWTRYESINNAEWKNAQDVVEGSSLRGVAYPVPEAVRRAQALPETDPDDPEFDRVCAVFAAAVLEDRPWPF